MKYQNAMDKRKEDGKCAALKRKYTALKLSIAIYDTILDSGSKL